MPSKVKSSTDDPIFTRGDVAKILNVTTLTIANREKAKKYPQPRRDVNGYRIYSLQDVFTLQLITYNCIDARPIMSALFDKGFRDAKDLTRMIDRALDKRKQSII